MKITWIFITSIYWLYAIENPIKNIKVINPNTPYEATIKIEENTTVDIVDILTVYLLRFFWMIKMKKYPNKTIWQFKIYIHFKK